MHFFGTPKVLNVNIKDTLKEVVKLVTIIKLPKDLVMVYALGIVIMDFTKRVYVNL